MSRLAVPRRLQSPAARSVLAAVVTFASVPTVPATAQVSGRSRPDRAAMVMGFVQDSAVHHFRLYLDGGAIEVTARHPTDTPTRDAIRSHLDHLAGMFADGNFNAPMLVHDPDKVPGIATLAALRASITYKYQDIPNGGRVDIVTGNPSALVAVCDFLKYQISAHRTGDSAVPTRR